MSNHELRSAIDYNIRHLLDDNGTYMATCQQWSRGYLLWLDDYRCTEACDAIDEALAARRSRLWITPK